MSIMMMGPSYLAMAATAATIRSPPTALGLSILIFSPVFIPEPTKSGRFPVIFFTAEERGAFNGGTTEERIEPSISPRLTRWISKIFFSMIAYSRLVFRSSVVILSSKYVLLSSIPPTTMLLFPISIAKIIEKNSFPIERLRAIMVLCYGFFQPARSATILP